MIQAAGLLVFRKRGGKVEVFLTHSGAPPGAHWGTWAIPKGEINEGESLLEGMEREFIEEVGVQPKLTGLIDLGISISGSGKKTNYIWAVEDDIDLADFHCDSMVTMHWPPKSDTVVQFPENDQANWFEISVAATTIYQNQRVFIERLAERLDIVLE